MQYNDRKSYKDYEQLHSALHGGRLSADFIMGIEIEETTIEQRSNFREMFLTINKSSLLPTRSAEGELYTIESDKGGSTLFQIKVSEDAHFCNIYIKFFKQQHADEREYIIFYRHRLNIPFNNKQLVDRNIYADNTTSVNWHLIDGEMRIPHCPSYHITISVSVTTAPDQKTPIASLHDSTSLVQKTANVSLHDSTEPVRITPNASLHDDTELTDFEFRGVDGSVHLHKAIVAAASPVLRRMFAGEWRETAKGGIEVPDTTKATLQHFKDYIYLDTVPDTGLEHLILLASMYILPDLEKRCTNKMIQSATPESAGDLFFFAANHHLDEVFYGLLQKVQDGSLKVDDIRKHNNIKIKKIEKK